ncbi:MAG: hypothetical protein MAG451_01110 [Anaerolineales bacterium]|nr:hypothetical protein [Anaerolineales bacterium]
MSLAAQRAPDDARFLVANFARPASPFAGLFEDLSLLHPLEAAGPREVGRLLTQLTALVEQRLEGGTPDEPDVYFLIAGLHRWRELRPPDPYGQSEAGKQLLHLAEEGPELGIHIITWADGFTTLERALKRGGVGAFDLRAVLRLPEADSNSLLKEPTLISQIDLLAECLRGLSPNEIPPAVTRPTASSSRLASESLTSRATICVIPNDQV